MSKVYWYDHNEIKHLALGTWYASFWAEARTNLASVTNFFLDKGFP